MHRIHAHPWLLFLTVLTTLASSDTASDAARLNGLRGHEVPDRESETDADSPALNGFRTFRSTGDALAEWLETASLEFYSGLSWLLLHLWVPFAGLAFCFLPVGHKRPRCDHHRPSPFNKIRGILLGRHPCTGECVLVEGYSKQLLFDDLAWSIWAIELGCWCYIIVLLTASALALLGLAVYITTGSSMMLVLGAFSALWIVMQMCSFLFLQLCVSGGGACCKVVFILGAKFGAVMAAVVGSVIRQVGNECEAIGRAVAAACQTLCPSRSSRRSAPSVSVESTSNAATLSEPLAPDGPPPPEEPPSTSATAAAGDSVLEAPQVQSMDPTPAAVVDVAAIADPERTLRFGGPQLEESTGLHPRTICGPAFARALSLLPVAPENMWGGVVGVVLGTHPLRNTYIGDSRIAELLRMGWRRPVDLSAMSADELQGWDMDVWHDFVRDLVVDVRAAGSEFQEVEEAMRISHRIRLSGDLSAVARPRPRAFNVVESAGSFTAEDGLFNWDEYRSNACWICCSDSPSWDMWVSCRHAFCSGCSEEMMRRVMPCPLCRTISTVVLRKAAAPDSPSPGGLEAAPIEKRD